jgi:flagellar protein FlaJ
MSKNEKRKWLKRVYLRARKVLQRSSSKPKDESSEDNVKSSSLTERIKYGRSKPQIFAYQLVGGRSSKIFPIFIDLEASLKRSGMKSNFKAYVSTTILAGLIASVSLMLVVPTVLLFVFNLSLTLSLLFGVGLSLLAGAITVIGFYVYPSLKADSLKRDLENDMTFTAGYMSILAGAGVPPDFIWRSLAEVDPNLAVSGVAKNVVRDVELFGFDVISALENTSKKTPSESFKELVEGFISVVHSGGSLVKYLRNRSEQYMAMKKISLKKFSDSLSVLAEFYVTLMVAGSLIFVVMLAVMGMLGSGGIGPFEPRLLLQLLTYIGLPVGSMIFLVVIDMISPKR